jgi:hypothetical protein
MRRLAWPPAGRPCAGSARRSSSRAPSSRPTSKRDFASTSRGDRIRGRWDRVDLIPLDPESVERRGRLEPDAAGADVVEPTLGIMGPEPWTITDYKSSDVRDPVKARQRARESLQLQIYAMGYEAYDGPPAR